MGSVVGLFAREDGGTTWSTSNQGPANVQVRDLNWYSESGLSAVLLVATFGRGIWQATLNTLAAPAGLTVTPASATSVSLSWSAVTGATGYKVFRSSSLFSFSQIDTSAVTSYTDTTAPAGVAYLYMVRATDGSSDSGNSNADLATTVIFTDPTLAAETTTAKAAHISELRTASHRRPRARGSRLDHVHRRGAFLLGHNHERPRDAAPYRARHGEKRVRPDDTQLHRPVDQRRQHADPGSAYQRASAGREVGALRAPSAHRTAGVSPARRRVSSPALDGGRGGFMRRVPDHKKLRIGTLLPRNLSTS